MIKPATYWAAHKRAKDPMQIGRIAFALAGRESELTPPLTDAEHLTVEMILQDSDWMDERVEFERERHRRNVAAYRARMKDTPVTDVTDVTVTNGSDRHVTPSLRPSVRPSVRNKQVHTYRTESERACVRTREEKPRLGIGSGLFAKRLKDLEAAIAKDQSGGVILSGEFDTGLICAYLAGEGRTERCWRNHIAKKGEGAVLEECFKFYRELTAGEECRNRAAALNARLKKLPDAKDND